MKKILLNLILSLVLAPQYIWAAPTFSQPILGKAYEQVRIRIDTVATQASLDADAKKLIEQKKINLGNTLVAIDKAFQKWDKKVFKEQVRLFQTSYKDTMAYVNALKLTSATTPNDHKNIPKIGSTDITYYADSFEWGRTANGDVFSQSFYSAAACNIPFNTFVQVGKWERSVVVKVNDRPNCKKYPNLTDLTSTAFRTLGSISSGRFAGTIQILGTAPKDYIKKTILPDTFQKLWIELDSGIPNTYLKNETLHITGKELLSKTNTLIYMQSPSGKDIALVMKKWIDGRFEYSYPLEEIGTYSLVMASGNGFDSTNNILDVFVFDDAVFTGKKLAPLSGDIGLLSDIQTERIELSNLTSFYRIRFPTADFHTLTITDGLQTVAYHGFETIALWANTLQSFDITKPVTVQVMSQRSLTPFSHDTYTIPVSIFKKTMTLSQGYREEKNENITTDVVDGTLSIRGIVTKGKNVKREIMITLPNGDVEKYSFDANSLDSDGYLKRGKVFEKTIELSSTGVYLVEVNYDNGFAAYNGPIVYGDVLPLYSSDMDGATRDIGISDGDKVAPDSLNYVNKVRARSGKPLLRLDDQLSALALIKAQDMAAHNTISHTDSHGEKIIGTAKRNGIQIAGSVGENIAGGNLSFHILLIGLANSWGHRANMLDDWGTMGVGYVVKDGQVYYVQVFGE